MKNFNPILKEEKLSTFSLFKNKIDYPSKGKAFVYVAKSGEKLVIFPHERPTSGEMRWNKYHTRYTIDISEKMVEFNKELESKDPLEKFRINIEYLLKVQDPKIVIEGTDTNIAETVERKIIRNPSF